MYKNILLGTNTFAPDWLDSIKRINKPNIIIADFSCSNLEQIISENKVDYIIPLSVNDYNLVNSYDFINKHKILFPDDETYELLDNKVKFTQFLMDNNFVHLIPKVYYLNNTQINPIEFPVMSKPACSTNGYGMKIYCDNEEFVLLSDKTLVQKFVDDQYEFSAYLLCIKGNIINWKVIGKKYGKYTIKKINFPKDALCHDDFDITMFIPLMKLLNYTGGACINFKFNKDTNKLDIFEINPRFGGSAFSNDFIYELLCIK